MSIAVSPRGPVEHVCGVVCTREPRSGEPVISGDWRVASPTWVPTGSSAPLRKEEGRDRSLEIQSPQLFEQLRQLCTQLELQECDLLEIEFRAGPDGVTVVRSRSRERSPKAELRLAVALVQAGALTKEEALLRLPAARITEVFSPAIAPGVSLRKLTTGLAAGLGGAVGQIAFSTETALRITAQGQKVILIRKDMSPEDAPGIRVAAGVISLRGGLTSHAAVIARVFGRPCIVSCPDVQIDERTQQLIISHRGDHGETPTRVVLGEGEVITMTVDATGGAVFHGEAPMVPGSRPTELDEVLTWADEIRTLQVRANADSESEVITARSFGAEGVGLCRTEHMFLAQDRVMVLRRLLLSTSPSERIGAHDELVAIQRNDLAAFLRAANGWPVAIRLLDPPLHEFLPTKGTNIDPLAHALGLSTQALWARVEERREVNPMLGQRGVRIAFIEPEIYASQIKALFEAACDVLDEGCDVQLELLIPLVMSKEELTRCRAMIDQVTQHVFSKRQRVVAYKLGVMIELPRAALIAESLASEAQSFSFGTNDLTQTTLGLSRDDAPSILNAYRDAGAALSDPFRTIDRDGVGALVQLSIERGRMVQPKLELGVCGEHASDPASIEFFQSIGIGHVSCAPSVLPVVRIAAAQAQLRLSASASLKQ